MPTNCTYHNLPYDHQKAMLANSYASQARIHLHKGLEYMFCGPYVFELKHRAAIHITSDYYASYAFDRFGSPTHAIERVIYCLIMGGK